MAEQRNIVILGASIAGLSTAHYVLKHILPALKAKKEAGVKYHLRIIDPSSEFFFRIASPRTAASAAQLPIDKSFYDISASFKQYSADDVTLIEGSAVGWDTSAHTVTYRRNAYLQDETVSYHALIVATGSKTFDPAFSIHTTAADLRKTLKNRNVAVQAAKDIIVVGGGPTAVEHAAELGELLNGKPGWFSTPPRKANITLITATNQLSPTLRPAISKVAENKLRGLGVDVIYSTRVADHSQSNNGRTIVTLAKGEKLEADLFIPAYGVQPNSSFIDSSLLTDTGYSKTNKETQRVDDAGPRVYALGDISTASRNTVLDLYDTTPALMINMKRDLLSFNPDVPDQKPTGKDRLFKPQTKEMMIVPIGSAGGVGAVFGWKVPSWFVWLIKSRDFMIGMGPGPLISGDKVKKEFAWTKEEAVA